MKQRRATLLLLLALVLPAPASAEDYSAMFGLMFRMMLTAMNVMADMAGNNNDWGGAGWPASSWANPWGSSWMGSSMLWPGMGLGGWPGSGLGMSPLGMSPLGMSSLGMNPLDMNPWGAGMPWGGGYSPWNAGGFGGMPWRSAMGGAPGSVPGVAPGVPFPVRSAPWTGSLLDGKWFGNTGEILEIHGNRFRLRNAQLTIKGVASIEDNFLRLYTPQTNALSVYSFVRNQTELILEEPSGNVLVFQRHPVAGFGNPVLF